MRLILLFIALAVFSVNAETDNKLSFHDWALTPPMGWNSWDCFGPSVVEDEVKANADYMAANLLEFGWEYVVVDIRWYVDNQTSGHYNAYNNSTFIYDDYGRYMPSPTRFPSAANGAGFKPLADYVHGKGLKFGIHIMRGVPKEAVKNSLPIKGGGTKTAADIYSTAYECTWLQDNYTVVKEKEGAQAYYNSIFDLYASWGVDYVKVDDLSRPYHNDEIEMIRKAIDQTGRPIVLSMSPGATPIDQHDHARNNANLWRTIDDFWDNWSQLNYSFGMCAKWAPYISPGAWPDADMLPLGKFIRGERATDRYTNFTKAEQYTLMTLWTMFKSPLMFGGNLPDNDAFTDSILTNDEVLFVHGHSVKNKELSNENDVITWTADDPYTGDKFVALFNNGGDGFVRTKDIIYRSGTVSKLTDGYGVDIDVTLPEGSNELYLIVNDGGENINCDHADWINPTVYLANGDSIMLTDLDWEFASSGWNTVQVNKSISGGVLNVKGKTFTNGFGTHSKSVISFGLPENTVRFKAFAGLDIAGTDQGCGSTVEFMLSVVDPTGREVNMGNAIANSGRVSRTINREGVSLSADITEATKLYLVVTDAGDNFNYDHADWINPAIYKANGDSMLLTDLSWVSATSGWDQVKKNTSLDGNALKVNGTTYANGYGVNSYSTIEFDLPQGYTTFKAFCGFDDEVANASEGVTVEFLVFTQNPSNSDKVSIPVDLVALGFNSECLVRNLWEKREEGTFTGSDFAPSIETHGAALYRISAVDRSTQTMVDISASSTRIAPSETLKLDIDVVADEAASVPTGWLQVYQNDSLLANIYLGDSSNIQLLFTSLPEGEYTFKANYGGDTIYAPHESGVVTVTVAKDVSSVNNRLETGNGIWLNNVGGVSYLNGIKPGDSVVVYTIEGKKVNAFVAQSDRAEITAQGVVVIEVVSSAGDKSLKAVL